MKILITGGNGQVGKALVATAPHGWDIAVVGRDAVDIADFDAARAAIDAAIPDILINAAAYTAVDRAENDADSADRINGAAVANLADACAARGVRLVHYSTDFIFDGLSSRPYSPDDRPAPLSVYGRSKLAGETAAAAIPANLILRTSWVYSAGGASFLGTMLRLMAERDEVRVVADQVGTPTHALSLARATWRLVEKNVRGVHHFTDAGVASWYDFAVAIAEEARAVGLLDRDVPVIPIPAVDYPTPARRPAFSVLDKTSCWKLLGAPSRHWRAELRDALASLAGHEKHEGKQTECLTCS